MKNALLFGLIWWVVIFFEVSIVGFTPGLATTDLFGFTLLPIGVAIHFVAVALLAWGLGAFYFRKRQPVSGEGLRAALIISAVGLLLDAAITVPVFVKSYAHYYSKWTLWVGLLIFVAVFTAISLQKEKRAQG